MLNNIENFEIVTVLSKKSKLKGFVSKRKTDAFNIRVSGSMDYHFNDKTLTVNAGEMIFLPRGSNYTWEVTSEEESNCVIIHLNGHFNIDTLTVYSIEKFIHNDVLINSFSDLWNFGDLGEKYECYAYIYELLSFIHHQNSIKYPDEKKFTLIEPAIQHLRQHVYDTSLKIDKLHNLCGLSHTYFRKIFIKEMGMNPKEYVVEKRLSHAKIIIENGDMDSVKQLALSVGYDDPLYFSKAFKKKFGISPSKMNLL